MLNSFSGIDYLNFDYNYMKYTQEELDFAVRNAEHQWFVRWMKSAQEIFDSIK